MAKSGPSHFKQDSNQFNHLNKDDDFKQQEAVRTEHETNKTFRWYQISNRIVRKTMRGHSTLDSRMASCSSGCGYQ